MASACLLPLLMWVFQLGGHVMRLPDFCAHLERATLSKPWAFVSLASLLLKVAAGWWLPSSWGLLWALLGRAAWLLATIQAEQAMLVALRREGSAWAQAGCMCLGVLCYVAGIVWVAPLVTGD
jgi:hypothetical protein